MSNITTYPLQNRTTLGTHAAVKLRNAGIVPVTVSRPGKTSTHLQVDEKSAMHMAANVVHLCKLDVDGKQVTALRAQFVKDVLTDRIKHIDLIEVDEKSEIKVDVAVVPDARNCPGVVELRARKITVRCKANAIPDNVHFDLSNVELQQSVTVGAITLPAGVTLVTPAKQLLLSVVIPRGMKALADEAEAAALAAGATAAPGATPAAGDAKAATPAAGDAKAAAPAPEAKKK
jgi:large subunit ribosomal protein L25